MADVRKALREAQQQQVVSFALAIDAQARHHLPQLFGAGNYEVLPHPGCLTRSLTRVFGRLLR